MLSLKRDAKHLFHTFILYIKQKSESEFHLSIPNFTKRDGSGYLIHFGFWGKN